MDRRIEKTRKAIIDSLSNLMKTKEFQDITVENIIKKAMLAVVLFMKILQTKMKYLMKY